MHIEPGDIVAGLSVALVVIPQGLAYAQLAGMPAHRGLYAAAVPPLAAALLASSPHLQTGPTALTALLSFAALSALATPASPEYVQLGLLLAVIVGVVRVAVGLLRAGAIAYLMSSAVLLGFVPAATALIVASQLPAALGVAAGDEGILAGAASALGDPRAWTAGALALTAATVVAMRLGARAGPLFPAVLVAVGIGMLATELLGYGGATVGEVPGGLPPVSVDLPWAELPSLLVSGTVIALIGFAEPASVARTLAAQERRPWDPDREFVSQGAANVAAGFTGGFPVGGSFSRSALTRSAGGRTRWSGAVTGLAVLALLPFAGIFSSIPTAVLAAVVIGAVAPMVRLRPILDLWPASRPQFAVAAATAGLTLVLAPHVERAVVAGVVLAVAVHLWRELRLDIEVEVRAETLHLHPRGVIWFGTAPGLEDRLVRLLADHPGAGELVIHLDGVGRLDLSGALALRNVLEFARGAGLGVSVDGVPAHAGRIVAAMLDSPSAGPGRGGPEADYAASRASDAS